MGSQEIFDKHRFTCNGISINFIYSFNFKKERSYVVEPEELVRKKRAHAKLGTPKIRKGITPHLTFEPDYCYIDNIRPVKASVVYRRKDSEKETKLHVSINTLIRIFRTGCTCTLNLDVPHAKNEPYDKDDILGILNLVTTRERGEHTEVSKLLKRTKTKQETRLYSLFYDSVQKLCNQTKYSWLGDELKFINVRSEVQSPWVVTLLETDGDVASAFCDPCALGDDPARTKALNIRRYQHDIAPILFRSVSSEGLSLEPSYLAPPYSNSITGLFSLNLDARLFVTSSRRSILCICRNKLQDPAMYFIPGLLDICEMLRTRWHMLIMLNKVLDTQMNQMLEGMRSGKIDTEKSLVNILELREWLALSLQDPGIYIVAGDALSKIYDEIHETLRFEQLTNMVFQKATQLDKIHNDIMDYQWMSTSPHP